MTYSFQKVARRVGIGGEMAPELWHFFEVWINTNDGKPMPPLALYKIARTQRVDLGSGSSLKRRQRLMDGLRTLHGEMVQGRRVWAVGDTIELRRA